jgi:hypothetical protein
MSALGLLPKATAKADFRTRSCLLYPQKRTSLTDGSTSARKQPARKFSTTLRAAPCGASPLAFLRAQSYCCLYQTLARIAGSNSSLHHKAQAFLIVGNGAFVVAARVLVRTLCRASGEHTCAYYNRGRHCKTNSHRWCSGPCKLQAPPKAS